jgi:hypothetical protein
MRIEKTAPDKNLLWDVQNIKWGQLCAKVNVDARYGLGFLGRQEMRL